VEIHDGSFLVPGVRLGHWTHPSRHTGCTVLLVDELVPAAVEVRGGAPGTRETNLLDAGCTVQGVDAVLLTGGSAFGLAAADGVMRWLREHKRGFPTSAIPVPIVSGAVIFDLVGDAPAWPDAESGYAATRAAMTRWHSGRVGAGAGARVSKGYGRDSAIQSGIGVAQITVPAGTISAIFVVNAVGDIADDQTGDLLTRPLGQSGSTEEAFLSRPSVDVQPGQNTVIGAVACDRALDSDTLKRMTIAAHSGLARVIRPAHTPADGDTIFALAAEKGRVSSSELMQLTTATQVVVARAIANSVRTNSGPAKAGN
jgi:L-aminopeptidase/D-esterase-like protein